jgi:hypothetical protein
MAISLCRAVLRARIRCNHAPLYVVVHQQIHIGLNPDDTVVFAQVGVGVIGRDALLEKGHLCAGAGDGRTLAQACQHCVLHCFEVPAVFIVARQQNRNPDLWRRTGAHWILEAGWHDARDRIAVVINFHRLAQNSPIAVERLLPDCVAQDDRAGVAGGR